MEKLFTILDSFTPLSQEDKELISKIASRKSYKKNDFILKQTQICHSISFIDEGAVKSYYKKQEKEVVNWFAFEGHFVASLYSILKQKRSYENIQCIESTEAIVIPYNAFQQLCNERTSMLLLSRKLIEYYYTLSEERILSLQFQSARERYENLLKNEPHLLQRVSLRDIASYLDITQVSLSRIRAQRK